MIDFFLSKNPEAWLNYLLIYAVPGVFMTGYLIIKMLMERRSDFAKSLMKIMGKEESLLDKIKEAAIFGFGLICVLVGWPGFIYWLIKEKWAEVNRQKRIDEPDFNCRPEHLGIKVNPIDAETASYVTDPLNDTPSLPFGHLNKGWINFLADMTDQRDEMWSFHIPKGSKAGKYQRPASADISGYARVRGGKILGEFLTESD